LRILTPIEEHSRAFLRLKAARHINSVGVIKALADALCQHRIPGHIRRDNGLQMISKAPRKWVADAGSQIQHLAPGSRSTALVARLSAARAGRLPGSGVRHPIAAPMQQSRNWLGPK
jgi:transposase InsO family protein